MTTSHFSHLLEPYTPKSCMCISSCPISCSTSSTHNRDMLLHGAFISFGYPKPLT